MPELCIQDNIQTAWPNCKKNPGKIMQVITTSRNSGKAARSIARQLAKKLNIAYFGRRNASFFTILSKARFEGARIIIVVNRLFGNNFSFQVVELNENTFVFLKKLGKAAQLEAFLRRKGA